jgi:glycosyltransferase involved in cell wall biosynthesis
VRLIEAFNRFKERTGSPWQLVLGGADWHGAEVVHRAIDASPHARAIHRLGFVSDADLPRWYQAAGAFVYPSLFEGFGFPPLEAMACGCPVVCSPRGALAETVGDAAALVDPEDAGAIEQELTRVATDAGWRNRLQAAGLERAAKYNWERTAAGTMAVYAHALQPAGSLAA